MHNKFCIIDKNIVLNGSYNWTDNAERNNLENIQVTYDDTLASKFLIQFDEILKECKSSLKSYSEIKSEILILYNDWYNYAREFDNKKWVPILYYIPESKREVYHRSHFTVLGNKNKLYLGKHNYKFEVIDEGYYLFHDIEAANNFLYQDFFLSKEYDLNTVQEITGKKMKLPVRIFNIKNLKPDELKSIQNLTKISSQVKVIITDNKGNILKADFFKVSKDGVHFTD